MSTQAQEQSPETPRLTIERIAEYLDYEFEEADRSRVLGEVAAKLGNTEKLSDLATQIRGRLSPELKRKYPTTEKLVSALKRIEWNYRIQHNFLGRTLGSTAGRVQEVTKDVVTAPFRWTWNGVRWAWSKPWIRWPLIIGGLAVGGYYLWQYIAGLGQQVQDARGNAAYQGGRDVGSRAPDALRQGSPVRGAGNPETGPPGPPPDPSLPRGPVPHQSPGEGLGSVPVG